MTLSKPPSRSPKGDGWASYRRREAARANFNIMPEPRLRERLGISKQTAQQSFNKAIRNYGRKLSNSCTTYPICWDDRPPVLLATHQLASRT